MTLSVTFKSRKYSCFYFAVTDNTVTFTQNLCFIEYLGFPVMYIIFHLITPKSIHIKRG